MIILALCLDKAFLSLFPCTKSWNICYKEVIKARLSIICTGNSQARNMLCRIDSLSSLMVIY